MLRFILSVITALTLSGCSDWTYENTDTGELKGKLVIEWIDQDNFLFIPDPANPLTFTRKNKEVIVPAAMYTDGGTIPQALRAIKSYSPWGYAPAFIVHDWLFVMQHCKIPGYEAYDLGKAATVMAEIIKTIMENPKYGGPNKLVLYSMYEAVQSKTAKEYWESGKCDTPTGTRTRVQTQTRSAAPPPANASRHRVEISFP